MSEHRFVYVPTLLAREHLNAKGKPKRKLSKTKAEQAAERLGRKAYLCGRCHRWHVGSAQ